MKYMKQDSIAKLKFTEYTICRRNFCYINAMIQNIVKGFYLIITLTSAAKVIEGKLYSLPKTHSINPALKFFQILLYQYKRLPFHKKYY